MSRIFGVVADDFTGACDAGVQFRKRGLETVVLTDIEKIRKFKAAADVVVVDTETRNLKPKAAYNRMRRTLKALQKMGVRLVYEKVDSTMRGNVGAELDAVLEETAIKGVLVAPSYPQQGRTVLNGQVYVNGALLEKTEFASELTGSMEGSRVQTLIGRQSDHKIGQVDLSTVRAGPDELRRALERTMREGNRIIVADAETQEDLEMVAKVSIDLDLLPCGSAGLAEKVASLMASERRVLVVSGSFNRVTLDQIEIARRELGMQVVEPDLNGVLVSDEKLRAAAISLADKIGSILQKNETAVMRLASSKNVVQKALDDGEKLGISHKQVAEKLLSVLGMAVDAVSSRFRLSGLVLIGGDSSAKVADAIGAEGIQIEAEIFSGIPFSTINGGKHEGMRVVTKAGGFGDEQTLVDVINYLKKNV